MVLTPSESEGHRIRLTDPLRRMSLIKPLTRPHPLLSGARVAVLAVSSPSDPERIEPAADRLRQQGLDVWLAPNLYQRTAGYLAGSDSQRVSVINEALRSDQFDAFFFARGGYGAMRILDGIDYEALRRNPRPLIGYSDLTAVHQAMAIRAGVGGFHGPMLNTDFFDGLSPVIDNWFWTLLRGDAPSEFTLSDDQIMVEGLASGTLFGGCLSLTHSLLGTPFDFWIDDGIWFWEDVGEATYRIDRMLTHLRLSGKLQSIRGVMIGKLKQCGDTGSGDLKSLLEEFFSSAGIPVLHNLPFGHFGDNLLLPIGARVEIDTRQRRLRLPDPVVMPG